MIKNEFPPNYNQIKNFFPNCEERKAVFTYFPYIYNPFNQVITPDLEHHEKVHIKQQGDNPQGWWDKYCTDSQFRYEMELDAYSQQYKFLKEHHTLYETDKGDVKVRTFSAKTLNKLLDQMASALTGDLYQLKLDYGKIRAQIRLYGN